MSEDAAKATAGLISLQRLDEVIIEKPDSPDLRNKETERKQAGLGAFVTECFMF